MQSQLEPISVSVAEACRISNLGLTKMHDLIASKKVASVKIGGKRLVNYKSLKRLLNAEAA